VTKLNSTGSALVYSTFLGGNSGDYGYAIAVDSSGRACVAGETWSSDFPTTAGAFQTKWSGSADAFVTMLNCTGSSLVYSTFLGGSMQNEALAIALDSADCAYVAGVTMSTDFPTTTGAFQTTVISGTDAFFVSKLNMGVLTVTPSAGAGGTISPATAQLVDPGSSVIFTAAPSPGYTVNAWSLDGTPVQIGGTSYTLSDVTASHTVSVTFSILTYTVTPSAGANGTISPSTAQTVNYGSSVTFTATPSTGYAVAWWLVDGVAKQSGGTTFTLSDVTANHTVSVTFNILTYTLTPSAGANGTISPSAAKTVIYGSSVLFTATPNAGYAVNTWSVDGNAVRTGGTSFTVSDVTANHSVSVSFIAAYTVAPSAGANGTISPSSAQTVNSGSSATFTATPNTGYTVAWWWLDGKNVQAGGSSYTLPNVTANHTVSVSFNILTYKLTPSAGASGTISPSTVKTVTYGSSLAFTATPSAGYTVNTWSVDGNAVRTGGTSYTVANATANHTVSVSFITAYTVTPSAGASGTISPSTAQTVPSGGSASFKAVPNTGYAVGVWSVDGSPVQTGGTSYTLPNVAANHTVSVTFNILTYTVTPSAGANGTISPSTVQTVNYGGSVAFTATCAPGYTVAWWLVDGKPVQSGGTSFTLSNVTANHTVSATFNILTYTLTPSAGANGTISPSAAKTVTYGSSVLFTATPATGYSVNAWSLDGTIVQTGGTTYTLSNIISGHAVSVTFH
jgi:methyl coenzyme M reductase beta subunit